MVFKVALPLNMFIYNLGCVIQIFELVKSLFLDPDSIAVLSKNRFSTFINYLANVCSLYSALKWEGDIPYFVNSFQCDNG